MRSVINYYTRVNGSLKLFLVLLVFYAVWYIKLNLMYLESTIKCNKGKDSRIYLLPGMGQPVEKKVKIFCFILTHEKKLERAKIVGDTWAKKCDNFKFILKIPDNIKDDSIINFGMIKRDDFGGVELNNLLEPPGIKNDTYRKLTDKVYSAMRYIFLKYPYYDWYLKADDDTFIFVDNLKKFLSTQNASSPVSFGHSFNRGIQYGYHSGGAGYVLSNEAMRRIGSSLSMNFEFCPNRKFEDLDVSTCLRKLGVVPGISQDSKGRERFHPLSIRAHYNGKFPKWLIRYSFKPPGKVIRI